MGVLTHFIYLTLGVLFEEKGLIMKYILILFALASSNILAWNNPYNNNQYGGNPYTNNYQGQYGQTFGGNTTYQDNRGNNFEIERGFGQGSFNVKQYQPGSFAPKTSYCRENAFTKTVTCSQY